MTKFLKEVENRIPKLNLWMIWLCLSAVCLTLFAPPFLTYDSYHYLSLAISPLAGDSHSMGYGWILLTLAKIADLFSKNLFVYIYLIYNSFCFSFLIWSCLRMRQERAPKNRYVLYTFLLFSLPILLGNFLLLNAFWSEMTSYLEIILFVLLAKKLKKSFSLKTAFLITALSVYAYHTRYLLIILPLTLIAYGILNKLNKRFIALGTIGLLSVLASNPVAKMIFPSSPAAAGVTRAVLQSSIQCTLRCDVSLFSASCTTDEGRSQIESIRCSELIFGLKSLGTPKISRDQSTLDIFKFIGFKNTIKWALFAPFSYLKDTHALEVGYFSFGQGQDQLATKEYPEATAYFFPYFQNHYSGSPSKLFQHIIHKTDELFLKHFFHWLTAIIVCLNIALIFSKETIPVKLLALYSVGTYLLFSYFNPHVPFRFLMQIITPGFCALFISYTSKDESGVTHASIK